MHTPVQTQLNLRWGATCMHILNALSSISPTFGLQLHIQLYTASYIGLNKTWSSFHSILLHQTKFYHISSLNILKFNKMAIN